MGSLAWYLTGAGGGLTWVYAVIAWLQCVAFHRLSAQRYFPRPLFLAQALSLLLYMLGTIGLVADWWVAFAMNRLFEASLLYLISCAIVRIRKIGGGGRERRPSAEATILRFEGSGALA